MYIRMLASAFTEATDLIEFVDNLSNGNLRRALEFVTMFIGSGHVDSEKIFSAIESQGHYNLPLHEFLRAVIHGDFKYFDPSKSRILNVFDLITNDPREHFLTLCLLACVERSATDLSTEGFVPLEAIYSQLQGCGFAEFSIKGSLDRCIEKELISPPKVYSSGNYDRVRINSAGAYTAKRLVQLFTYVDAMIVDTPICAPAFRKQILREYERIDDRLDRADAFVEYLDSQWPKELSILVDWNSIRNALSKDIAKARGKAEARRRIDS